MGTISNWKDVVSPSNGGSTVRMLNIDSALQNYNTSRQYAENLSGNMQNQQANLINAATHAQSQADAYNAEQARLQREFTLAMSSTAHQREVKDLQAAGLNPALSAGGNGAPMGSAAAASSSNQLTGVFGSLASTAMKAVSDLAQTQLNNSTSIATNANAVNAQVYSTKTQADVSIFAAKLQAQTQLSMNAATNAMNERIAQIQSITQQNVARIAGEYNLEASRLNAYMQQYAADLAYEANIYNANKSYDKALMEKLVQRATDSMNIDQKGAYDMISSVMHMVGAIIPG